jgi:hypothetical protein
LEGTTAISASPDAEIAEVFWEYSQVLDPYGVEPDLPPESYQTGRDYFALSPRSEVWVWFGGLPEATCGALDARIRRRSKFN